MSTGVLDSGGKPPGFLPCPSIVQLPSHVRLSETPWTAARQASLSFTISLSLFKLMSIESVMPINHNPLLSPSPLALSLPQHQSLFQ